MDPHNPIIVDLMDRKRKQTMLEDLKHFKAPPTHHWLIGIPIIALVLLACNLDFDSALTDEKIIKESKQAVAAERSPSVRLPLAHPLGCPEEDERGRTLQATISIKGERRVRCYYGSMK